MNYKELAELIAEKEGFDISYTIDNLSVKEVFYNDYILNSNDWFDWEDVADKYSIKEAMGVISA